MMATHESPPGLDLGRLAEWFAGAVRGSSGHLSAHVLAGGRSNLTYLISDESAKWVIRRPPLGHVLDTAHDMAREYRVMSALQNSTVPVPVAYAFCADETVIGTPFYVMEHVEGSAYRFARELEPLGPDRTRAISVELIETLARLHSVDPHSVGLGDFGRPSGFLTRQIRRWRQQLDASYSRDLPSGDELYAQLVDRTPPASLAGIVHGDYRLDNVIIDSGDRLSAVIDWEMATLGDPLTDLALLVLYQRLDSLDVGGVLPDASKAPGFLSESELLERYAAESQRDLSRLGFYIALAAFKFAGVVEGLHYRHLQGQTVGSGFDGIGVVTEPVLDIGLAALKED